MNLPDDDLPPPPDVVALRRRVLLTGLLTLAAWIAALVVLDAVGAGPWAAAAAFVLLYVTVTRPLMRPVRDAIRLRRRLAYLAWLDARDDDQQDTRP